MMSLHEAKEVLKAMHETDHNHNPGPHTDAGKQRSSLNALKHGIFARSILIPGESQEDFDKLLYHYHKDYRPKGAPEEDLVRHLVETEWRRRRIPDLEAQALEKSLETGDVEHKFMITYGIYEQRLNRTFQNTLKTLLDAQTRRRKENAVNFGLACILYHDHKTRNIPWKPADDGFVFSYERIERQFDLFEKLSHANAFDNFVATDQEIAEFFAREVQ